MLCTLQLVSTCTSGRFSIHQQVFTTVTFQYAERPIFKNIKPLAGDSEDLLDDLSLSICDIFSLTKTGRVRALDHADYMLNKVMFYAMKKDLRGACIGVDFNRSIPRLTHICQLNL